ncbi:solute carrier family 22 member 15-like [Elysia marginata]|uniref:Solute carrier family 22 member 15-like n=1 Tax=Elysia marginata TaxID=1093978 RepID=A0AAV4JV04_9GAST|nr:solute carrier family 22 member 15-like [Elysia marginata]
MGEYENILHQIRSFGPFQVRLFVLVSLFETPLAWAMLVPIFTAANPGFFCSDNSDSDFFTNSTKDDDVCYRNKTICSEILAQTEFTSIVTEWQLICDLDYVGELITSLQMMGVGIGAFITGQLADIFGRKKILFIEYALLLIVWFSTAFADSWEVYAALRVMVGGLVGGCLVVNFVLPLEFVSPRWRTFCGCIGFWAVGLMTLAPWAYFIRDWRKLNIAMSSCGITLLFLWWFIDESPRWLLIKGRFKEAENIIVKAAHFNKRPVPNLDGLQEFVRFKTVIRLRAQEIRWPKLNYSPYHDYVVHISFIIQLTFLLCPNFSVNRNIGIASCSIGARIGGIVAPQFVYLGHTSKVIPFTIFGCLALLCSLLLLVLTETRGLPLRDALHQGKNHNQDSSAHCKGLLMDTQKPLGNGVLVNGTDCAHRDGKL